MISYQVYKLVHFLGIFMLMCALGATVAQKLVSDASGQVPWRRATMITHGAGLVLILLGGFGMLARLGIVGGLPGWIHAKLAIWVVLGAAVVLLRYRPALAKVAWWTSIALGVLAAYFAINKPF